VAEHVENVITRLGQELAPTSLLPPADEAAWLWLQTHDESQIEGRGNAIVDLWANVDLPRAVENVLGFAALQKGMVRTDEVRHLRRRLSSATETDWSRARNTARGLFDKAKPQNRSVLAYLFPEEPWAAPLIRDANSKKALTGFAHLLAFSGTERDQTATLVEKGANVWGLFGWVRPLAGSLVVGLGSDASQALEILAARWPQDTAPFLQFIREGSNA
jgi:hypothetical protein